MKKITPKEFAKRASVTTSSVYGWIDKGIIKAHKEKRGFSLRIQIDEKELEKVPTITLKNFR